MDAENAHDIEWVSDVWILLEVVLYENIFPYIVQFII